MELNDISGSIKTTKQQAKSNPLEHVVMLPDTVTTKDEFVDWVNDLPETTPVEDGASGIKKATEKLAEAFMLFILAAIFFSVTVGYAFYALLQQL